MNFQFTLGFMIIYYVTQIWSILIKISFNWQCFVCISITLMFNIIVIKNIPNSYWFIIVFFWFKRVLKSLNTLSLMSLSFFFSNLKSFLISLCYLRLYFFLSDLLHDLALLYLCYDVWFLNGYFLDICFLDGCFLDVISYIDC